jgi:hypothetical protein
MSEEDAWEAGGSYGAFTCPHCASLMGQFFIASITPENWSLISAPLLKLSLPVPVPPVNHRTVACTRPVASPLPLFQHPQECSRTEIALNWVTDASKQRFLWCRSRNRHGRPSHDDRAKRPALIPKMSG